MKNMVSFLRADPECEYAPGEEIRMTYVVKKRGNKINITGLSCSKREYEHKAIKYFCNVRDSKLCLLHDKRPDELKGLPWGA